MAVRGALRRLARHGQPPWLHTEVARRMAQRLELIRFQPERVVDWWSQLGAGAPLLVQAYPRSDFLRVEPDARWAQWARQAAARPWWARVARRTQDVAVIEQDRDIAPGVGLVWANMMLHAVDDPLALFERWHSLLQFDGFVMFSCLGPGTLRELRTLYHRLGWPTPTPAYVDMHDLGDMLVHAGFADPVMDQEVLTLRWSSSAALLSELRAMGANASPQRRAGLRTPRWRERLERELATLAAPDGSIGLTFEVAYGHAFKAAPRLRTGQATTVSLQDMRAMVASARAAPK